MSETTTTKWQEYPWFSKLATQCQKTLLLEVDTFSGTHKNQVGGVSRFTTLPFRTRLRRGSPLNRAPGLHPWRESGSCAESICKVVKYWAPSKSSWATSCEVVANSWISRNHWGLLLLRIVLLKPRKNPGVFPSLSLQLPWNASCFCNDDGLTVYVVQSEPSKVH